MPHDNFRLVENLSSVFDDPVHQFHVFMHAKVRVEDIVAGRNPNCCFSPDDHVPEFGIVVSGPDREIISDPSGAGKGVQGVVQRGVKERRVLGELVPAPDHCRFRMVF